MSSSHWIARPQWAERKQSASRAASGRRGSPRGRSGDPRGATWGRWRSRGGRQNTQTHTHTRSEARTPFSSQSENRAVNLNPHLYKISSIKLFSSSTL
ncbi:hypothetical protein MRB53_020243 [Persea americana]|uniref:Uncharacterized protein n=1 Tax=Persea americana TaxID=3435 RepID=A0ACC2L093_PERAE|nr:hypothetical protein MRB53_020243 [Persea americana]